MKLFGYYSDYQYYFFFGAFLFSLLIQLFYWLGIYIRFPLHKPGKRGLRKFPVSIIICARNEEENLRQNLPAILEQDYPNYEVIVVNDRSTDKTEDILEILKKKYPHLRSTLIKKDSKFIYGKKLALTIGIKSAKNEWLLLTDADCVPVSSKWLRMMQQHFTSNNSVVLGYSGYYSGKGLLNLLIRYETVFIAMQYLSFALAGIPYMGVGRNLAYRKSLFFQNKGFANHSHLSSGDDDLFINKVAKKCSTTVEFKPESHTFSSPKQNWKSWYYQKKRHLITAPMYKISTKILLSFELLSRILFYTLFVFLLLKNIFILYTLIAFVIRLLIQLLILWLTTRRLNEKYLFLPSPLFDIMIPVINAYIYFSNYVAAKRSRWK